MPPTTIMPTASFMLLSSFQASGPDHRTCRRPSWYRVDAQTHQRDLHWCDLQTCTTSSTTATDATRPRPPSAAKPRKRAPAATSSSFKGVSWIDNSKKWRAQVGAFVSMDAWFSINNVLYKPPNIHQIWSDNKVEFIGYYTTEEAAAQAFDKAVLLLGEDKQTNFPPESYAVIDDDPNVTKLRPRHPTQRRGDEAPRPPRPAPPKRRRNAANGPSSRYKGVSWSERSRKWRAQLWHDGKVQHLGFFDCEEDAARCYDRECLRKKGRDAQVNFPRPPNASDSEEDELPEQDVHRGEWGVGGLLRSGHNLGDVLEPDGRPYRLRDRQVCAAGL